MSIIVVSGRKTTDESNEPDTPAADLRAWTYGRIANLQTQREQLARRAIKANKADRTAAQQKLAQINAELQMMGVFIDDDDAPAAQDAAHQDPTALDPAHVDLGATLPLF